MPICDGVEATKRLRILETKRKAPVFLPSEYPVSGPYLVLTDDVSVVALSADCQESTKQLCLSAGMNSFFSKPLKKSTSCPPFIISRTRSYMDSDHRRFAFTPFNVRLTNRTLRLE